MSVRYIEIVEGDPERQVRRVPLTGHDTFMRDAVLVMEGWRDEGVSNDAQVRIHVGTHTYGIPEQVHKGTLNQLLSYSFLGIQE